MKRVSFGLAVVLIITSITLFAFEKCEVSAKTENFETSVLKDSELIIDISKATLYTVPADELNSGQVHYTGVPYHVGCRIKDDEYGKYYSKYGEHFWEKYEGVSKKILNSLKYTSSNPDVLSFVSYEYIEDDSGLHSKVSYSKSFEDGKGSYSMLMGLKAGTSTVTIYSELLKQKITCKITVKNAELTFGEFKYYTGNTYQASLKSFDDRIIAESYSSSNPKVAEVLKDGRVKTKSTGTATITCIADNGNNYKKTIKVEKEGLNYTKLTSYYFTGFAKGNYSYQPLIAKGITVKKWLSSNQKIATVSKAGDHVGKIKIKKCGNVKITAISQTGKKYTCQLTIVGGKPWSGLRGGYRPTVATLKKHGYYNDINKIQDYGDVIYYIIDYANEINYHNGNKKKYSWSKIDDDVERMLKERYPDKEIGIAGGGDLLGVDGDHNKHGRLAHGCYYVK